MTTTRRIVLGACALALLAGPVPAGADALVERYMKSDGLAGMGAFEGRSVTATSAVAQRQESTLKFTVAFLAALQKMSGGGDGVRITRLDRDLVWSLDPEKKTYTEALLTAQGERERRAPTAPPARPESRTDPSDVVVTRNEIKAEKTGAQKAINGFPCEEYLLTWLIEVRNQKTGETGKSTMATQLWTTPETAGIRAVKEEEAAYHKVYLQKIGLEAPPDDVRTYGLAALAGAMGFGDAEQQRLAARLRTEMAKIHGFPIVSQIEWKVEGSGGGDSQAARGGGGQQDLGSALAKLFGGGGGQKGAGEPSKDGPRPLFSLYLEVKRLEAGPPDPARYEIPAGYTRK